MKPIELLKEVFNITNNDILWKNRNSSTDIIALDTDENIRFKLNSQGGRNIELMTFSQVGVSYRTIALVENNEVYLPKEFYEASNQINIRWFTKKELSEEYNIIIGAFSLKSLIYSMQGQDADYSSNNIDFEMVKAFDGTIQNFTKIDENPFSISSMNILGLSNDGSLNGKPLVSFDFTNGNSGVNPTRTSHSFLVELVKKRLVEIYTIEKMP